MKAVYSSRFQLGEGPSRGFLRDCTTSLVTKVERYLGSDWKVAEPSLVLSPGPGEAASTCLLSPGHAQEQEACHHLETFRILGIKILLFDKKNI